MPKKSDKSLGSAELAIATPIEILDQLPELPSRSNDRRKWIAKRNRAKYRAMDWLEIFLANPSQEALDHLYDVALDYLHCDQEVEA